MSGMFGMLIPRILRDVFPLTAAPYRPIRMCDIPNDTLKPVDTLQIVLDP
jgi:hypothetical protein